MKVLGATLLMSVPTIGLSSDFGTDVHVHASRFQVLEEYRAEAVLDTETHLIWERSPSSDDRMGQCVTPLCLHGDWGPARVAPPVVLRTDDARRAGSSSRGEQATAASRSSISQRESGSLLDDYHSGDPAGQRLCR